EQAEHVLFARRSNRGGPRRQGPRGLQRSEPCEFVGSGSHLGTQPVENGEGGFLRARSEIARGADAGWTALFARACGDQFARFLTRSMRVRKSGSEKPMPPG